MKRFGWIAAGLFCVAISGYAVAQTRISIATGGTGGVYYPLGGGLANVYVRKIGLRHVDFDP